MGDEEKVWIMVKFDGDFESDSTGVWLWKCVGGREKDMSIPICVPKTLSYVELQVRMEEFFKIDCRLYDMVLRCPCPFTTTVSMGPIVICDDRLVEWFISFCNQSCLCITLKKKVCDNEENDMNGEEPVVAVSDNDNNMEEKHINDGQPGFGDSFSEGDSLVPCEDLLMSLDGDVPSVTLEDESLMSLDGDVPLVTLEDELLMSLDGDVSLVPFENELLVPYNSKDDANKIRRLNDYDIIKDIQPKCVVNRDVHKNVNPINGEEMMLVNIPEIEDFKPKQPFLTREILKKKLSDLAIKHHFEFRTIQSNNKLYIVKCLNETCRWYLRARRDGGPESKLFILGKYNIKHSCTRSRNKLDHRNVTYKVVGEFISDNYHDADTTYTPKNIIKDCQKHFGYKISYAKAYNSSVFGKEIVRGSPKKCYGELPKFLYLLEKHNPGSKTYIQTDENDAFEYLFMSLGACIRGFHSSIRRVVSVDGTFLKNNFKGTMLIATCQDGNYQIYPLAFAIVDSENKLSWTWFFEKLKEITGDTNDLAIISDRAESIKHGMKKVFQHARHIHCTFHMQKNLKTHFPRCDLNYLFRQAAEAYTVENFNVWFEALCSKHKGIRKYLDVESFSYWVRAYSDGLTYNMTTTNNSESINGRLKRPREFSALGLLKYVRGLLQEWFAERHDLANNGTSLLTPRLEEELLKRYDEIVVVPVVKSICPDEYEVRLGESIHVVNLRACTCTCKKFDMEKFPCVHVAAITKDTGKNIYNYCSMFYSRLYWQQAYSEFIRPLPTEEAIEYPESVIGREVKPPVKKEKNKSGPIEKKRKQSSGESRKQKKCRKCKETGHSSVECRSLVVSSSSVDGAKT